MNLIAERLKEFRVAQGHNQEGVAKVAGMSQRAWAGWEDTPPKALQSLVDLATHYVVSVDYLLNLTDDSTPRRDKLNATMQELIKVARRLSPRRLHDLLLVARAFAAADQNNESGMDGSAEGAPLSPVSPDDSGTIQINKRQWEAALNVYERRKGTPQHEDFLDTLADNFPDLAQLVGPITPSKKRGVNKS